jgi:methylated-DNA-[protein]-cysteine S-methyltransferase
MTLENFQARLATPFAVLGIRMRGELLTDIRYLPPQVATLAPLTRPAERACKQLLAYLDDPEYVFELPFEYRGTQFQCKVWKQICRIPCGKTLTYKDIARRLGSAPRPVGGACGANRIPLVIPCHRVVASDGLGGFMNSRDGLPLDIKRWLLRHEHAGARS